MRPLSVLFLLVYWLSITSTANAQITVTGYVEDEVTRERLIGASVVDEASGAGVSTDAYGYFSLSALSDSLQLAVSYIGYVSRTRKVVSPSDVPISIYLTPGATLQTVDVSADKAINSIDDRVGMSTVEIPMAQYRSAPVLLGETDILKTLQLMPGVQGGTEGTAGIYVRGGTPDQNLILLDGVPMYNVSHALGVFSVFNADAVQSVRLTKGGFPARFGGRLSSVLEIEMKDGPADRWRGEGAVGLTASRLTVGGPLGNKTRMLVSGRRTYFDAIYKPILAIRDAGYTYKEQLDANFYDTYLKVRHDINARHHLYLSVYQGGDRFATGDIDQTFRDTSLYREGAQWGNSIAALRWRWQTGPRTFVNTVVSFSRYGITYELKSAYADRFGSSDNTLTYESSVRDLNFKVDLVHTRNANSGIRAGLLVTQHKYRPGELRTVDITDEFRLDTTYTQGASTSQEAVIYVEHEYSFGPRLAVDYGVHASGFRSDASYGSIQPRLGIRYRTGQGAALKASFATMTQYINLITTESLSLPTDLWVPSTARVTPQRSWQAALGYVKQLSAGVELSAEAFYKSLEGVVSYLPGESFFEFNPRRSWEDKVTQGQGTVYGLELLAQRKVGRLTGWVGYTLSYNNRTYAEINLGRPFPFRYDRRHDFSTLATYTLSKRAIISGSWVFFTGNAYTLPQYRQYTGAEIRGSARFPSLGLSATPQSAERNQFRVSNSHRLDLSLTLTKPKRWGERAWVFSVYNAYWHKNPAYVRAKDVTIRDAVTGSVSSERQFQEVSLLPIVPSVAYQVKIQ